MERMWFVLWVIFFFINVIFVIGLFVFIIRRGNQRIAKEAGRKPLYKVTSSGRIGWWTYKGPFLQMRMYEDFLVIGYHQHIVLLYEEIDAIVPGGTIFRQGITIKHRCSKAPQRITVSVANLEKAVAVFEQWSVE